jgi:hypothetical protein
MGSSHESPIRQPLFDRGDAIDRFTVLETLGVGGMGVVVSAYDVTLDRKVAIKVLRPDRHDADPLESRSRLLREAQAMAAIRYALCMARVESVHAAARPGEREQLLGYVARSRRLQGRLRRIGIGGVVVVIALAISPLDGAVAMITAATLAIVVGVGYWITSGHIREWNERLREMEEVRAT